VRPSFETLTQLVQPKPSAFETFEQAALPFLPIFALFAVLPVVYLVFRSTWRELDEDAQRYRGEVLASGGFDLRPFVALPLCAVILTMQEYYGQRVGFAGSRSFFEDVIQPWLMRSTFRHPRIQAVKYEELYGFAWWAGARVVGYTVVPLGFWKIAFRRDSVLDLGLRVRGFWKHAWIYALSLVIVLPAVWLVSRQPDFATYYPFYKNASRSWFDCLCWEAMYFAQFFGLEVFFRGFFLGVLRKSFGSGAIFAMAVPYCMIHFQKPYLEVNGAIIAGIWLGSLSMNTKSIYQGFLLHITVAGLMDWLALSHRHALPHVFWPP
jgi:hypothetical protein